MVDARAAVEMFPIRKDDKGRAVHDHLKTLSLKRLSREGLRRAVVAAWLEEAPGDLSERHVYRYDVECLADGSTIFLTRPARINKGMDFVIRCEGWNLYKNGNPKPPGHEEFILAIKKAASNQGKLDVDQLDALHTAIKRVWMCEEPDDVIDSTPRLATSVDVERILNLGKWLFIEQDLTYWTESGRHMLMDAINSRVAQWRRRSSESQSLPRPGTTKISRQPISRSARAAAAPSHGRRRS